MALLGGLIFKQYHKIESAANYEFHSFGTGGEYPASSTSASEAANEHRLKQRGPIFILVTNLPLSFGNVLVISIFLIVLSAAGVNHLGIVWRVCFGIGIVFPLSVFCKSSKF